MPNASLRILQPESTTNYVLNPSLRFDTTGWNAVGSTIARTLARARFGIASLSVITNGAALNEGTFYRVLSLSGIQDFVTVSAYVRGAGKVRIRLIDNPRGAQWASQPVTLTDNRWTRLEVTGRCTGSNDMRLYVETADKTAKAVTFYVDGAQMEIKPYSTSYCDGDQPDCRWNLTAHATLSTRDASSRKGGRWVALAGPCRADDDIYLTVVGGLGMPPISNSTQPFAVAPGAYFQSTKVNSRVITLAFNTKNPSLQITRNPSLAKLHELRQQLIDIIKPDKGNDDDGFIFEYTDGPVPIYFSARYDAGLDGQWDIRNQWVNTFPVRLLSVSPMFWEDDWEVYQINFSVSLGLNRTVIARENGAWNAMNGGTDGSVAAMALGTKGEIYVSGNFSVINRNGTVSPNGSAKSIAVWDGVKFSALGNGNMGGGFDVNCVAVGPDGKVYAGGSFTSIGGVLANRIAYWTGSTWVAMATGLNNTVRAIAIAPNGDVYVGGEFTATGGGATINRVAKWDGAWHNMGAYNGMNGSVLAIAVSLDGSTVFVGGTFTDQNTNPSGGSAAWNYITSYSPSTNLFSVMGTSQSLNGDVRALVYASNGTLYIGGSFTFGNLGSTVSMNRVASWNGSQFSPLGLGMDSVVYALGLSSTPGILVAAGIFSTAGSANSNGVALWNGFTWVPLDVSPPYGAVNLAIIYHPNGNIYVGGQASGSDILAAQQTSIANTGSAFIRPVIYISGPGRLRWIENQTTEKKFYVDLSIFSGEEITVDFSRGTITSSTRGSVVLRYILPGSDFASFFLTPGENIISFLMTNDVFAQVRLYYQRMHWSVDATARGDELV